MGQVLEESEVVCKRLGEMLGVTSLHMVHENVNRFIEAWRGYHSELRDVASQ